VKQWGISSACIVAVVVVQKMMTNLINSNIIILEQLSRSSQDMCLDPREEEFKVLPWHHLKETDCPKLLEV
jgi:hypothetical protein